MLVINHTRLETQPLVDALTALASITGSTHPPLVWLHEGRWARPSPNDGLLVRAHLTARHITLRPFELQPWRDPLRGLGAAGRLQLSDLTCEQLLHSALYMRTLLGLVDTENMAAYEAEARQAVDLTALPFRTTKTAPVSMGQMHAFFRAVRRVERVLNLRAGVWASTVQFYYGVRSAGCAPDELREEAAALYAGVEEGLRWMSYERLDAFVLDLMQKHNISHNANLGA